MNGFINDTNDRRNRDISYLIDVRYAQLALHDLRL